MKSGFPLLLIATLAAAHPMGNFSVNHYTRLNVSAKGVEVTYVLDLAEVPTYQLLKEWKLDAKSSRAKLDQRAAEQAREWMNGIEFRTGGKRVTPEFVRAAIKVSDGAGGLSVARVETSMRLDRVKGNLEFEDRNFPERAGWKEIVIDSGDGASIVTASQGNVDRSKALTEYPADPRVAPPQDLRAKVEWQTARPVITKKIVPVEQPAPVAAQDATPSPAAAQQAPGTVVKGDFLSRVLAQRELGMGMILICMLVAFGLGATHAMSPGHGKTIVAAYLVGSRGTMRHAAFLGAMVTFTHTISVFAIGLATFFLSKYFVPESMVRVLEAISGLSIAAVGASLFYKRLKRLRAANVHDHHHHHDHDHAHDHDHDHHHHHDHDHDHAHGHAHSHVPQGEITLGSLIALGASGGLVPCPSAMVLLLFAISVGRIGLGLALLVAFSLGLAGVLMAIGMLVIYAKNWLPDPAKTSQHPAFRLVPVLSAAVIVCLGLLMTGVSLGWLRPGGLAG